MDAIASANGVAVLTCVAVAAMVQNLTGFAFGLLFMGLVSGLKLLPIPVAANAITLITILQSIIYLRNHRQHLQRSTLHALLLPMQVGVGLGIVCLAWWSVQSVSILRPMLGLVIVGAAIAFIWPTEPKTQPSSPATMALTATLAGWLGGLFSTSGPPLVFLLYRQPWPLEQIKATLTLLFGVSQVVRLGLLLGTGQFTTSSMPWAVAAFPLLLLMSRVHTRLAPPVSRNLLERVVALLLLLAGLALIVR